VHHPPLFADTDIKKCRHAFSEVTARHASFSFQLRQVVVFANSISVVGYCSEQLKDLVLDLDRELCRMGVPDNKKYISDSVFFGNVTICRFTTQPSARLLQAVRDIRNVMKKTVSVASIDLITCDAVCSRDSLTMIDSFKLFDGGGGISTDNKTNVDGASKRT
jgi:2'-5' RNA ligase